MVLSRLARSLAAGFLVAGAAAPASSAPGDPDPAFGTQGVALSSFGDDGILAMALQPNGRILTATLAEAGSDRATLRITRFLTGGTVDSSFGNAGVASVALDAEKLSTLRAMLRQDSDGKLVLAGGSPSGFSVTRLTTAGALDAGYGSGGTANTKIAGDDEAFALAQQGDGKVVAAGSADDGLDSDFAVVRYTTGGQPDASFSGDGIATVEFGGNDRALAVAVQASDGAIVIAGSTGGSNGDIAVARLTSTGAPDNGFGTGGKVTTAVSTKEDAAWAVLVQPDGKIVVAGEADEDVVLLRYTSAGVLDPGFGNGGIARTEVASGPSDGARALVRQADDKLVAAGTSQAGAAGDFAVVRYTAAGQPDTSFGSGGIATTSVAATFDEELTSLLLQDDGNLLAGGLSEDGATSYQAMARYLAPVTVETCGDADLNGSIQASDALRVLRNAVGQAVACPLAVCDVDASGAVQASDALRVLRKAVGQDVVLTCPS